MKGYGKKYYANSNQEKTGCFCINNTFKTLVLKQTLLLKSFNFKEKEQMLNQTFNLTGIHHTHIHI